MTFLAGMVAGAALLAVTVTALALRGWRDCILTKDPWAW